MPPDRIRPRRADVRRDLVQAARTEFLRVGFARSSLRQIARAAGYTKGAVYSNFASKQDLLVEVLAADFGSASSHLFGDAFRGDPSWDQVVEAIVEFTVSEVTSNAQMLRLGVEFALEAARDPELHEAYHLLQARRKDALLEVVAPLVRDAGAPTAEEVDAIFQGVVSLLTGFVVDRGVPGRETLTPEVMRHFLRRQLGVVAD